MDKSNHDKKDMRVFVPCLDTYSTCEAGGELTMPDYYPEIRRVISVSAEALPDSKYLSDGTLEVGGTLAFNLLYIGDDGAVSSVPYVTEYTHNISTGKDFALSGSDVRTDSAIESVSCRPLAPRTVSMKAKIKSRAYCDAGEECELKTASEDGSPLSQAVRRTLEKCESEIQTVYRRSFSATGNVSGEKSGVGNAKPICCGGTVLVDSALSQRGAVTVKGAIAASCLVLTAEGVYKTVTASIPFEERINADGVTPDCRAAAHGRVASVTASADQESGTMSFDAEYDIDAAVASIESVAVTDDIYSTEYTLETAEKDLDVHSLVCLSNGTVSVTGEGRRKTQRDENDYVISSDAKAVFERVDVKGDTAHFSGSCNFKTVIASGGDAVVEEFSVPLKYECPAETAKGNDYVWHAFASPCNTECRLEDSKLTASCKLYVFAEAVSRVKMSPIVSATVSAKERAKGASATMHICYPEKGQRIWEILKGCRANAAECERINRITRCDISDGSPLIVK